ncbi:hypothetical protein HDU96_009990 [Phlyctochytrium bullatum]|nr:hypothetical protein HDU96_009990 [Phlyctochytrium bullatum]
MATDYVRRPNVMRLTIHGDREYGDKVADVGSAEPGMPLGSILIRMENENGAGIETWLNAINAAVADNL